MVAVQVNPLHLVYLQVMHFKVVLLRQSKLLVVYLTMKMTCKAKQRTSRHSNKFSKSKVVLLKKVAAYSMTWTTQKRISRRKQLLQKPPGKQ